MVETDHFLPTKQNTNVSRIPITYSARKIATHYRNPAAGGDLGIEGRSGLYIEQLFQGWKIYICGLRRGRLKRFHFSETEHVAVRGFIDVFISRILNPRSVRILHFIFIPNGFTK